jgi:hypothetical protein
MCTQLLSNRRILYNGGKNKAKMDISHNLQPGFIESALKYRPRMLGKRYICYQKKVGINKLMKLKEVLKSRTSLFEEEYA